MKNTILTTIITVALGIAGWLMTEATTSFKQLSSDITGLKMAIQVGAEKSASIEATLKDHEERIRRNNDRIYTLRAQMEILNPKLKDME